MVLTRGLSAGLAGVLLLAAPVFAQRRGGGAALPQGLQFRFMGPAVGNRIAAAVGTPTSVTSSFAAMLYVAAILQGCSKATA